MKVKKNKYMELVATTLFGITSVPREYQEKMILRLAKKVHDLCTEKDKELEELHKANAWQPIECFDGDMFVLLTNGIPEHTTVYKYKGHIPEWATHWMPLPILPKKGETL